MSTWIHPVSAPVCQGHAARSGGKVRQGVLSGILLIAPALIAQSAVNHGPGPTSSAVGADIQRDDAPRPDLALQDFDEGCGRSGCHEQLTATRWVHGPAAVRQCRICHRPEGRPGAHRFQPLLPEGGLCRYCHRLAPAPGARMHEPFAQSYCTGCHDPHGGANVDLLDEARAITLCELCHEAFKDQILHRPVENGDCLACHDAHESSHAHLLLRSVPELCLGCHRQIGDAPPLDGGASEPIHTGCAACHRPHGGEEAAFLLQDVQSACLDCHKAVADSLVAPVSIHTATREGRGCRTCHAPHALQSDHLLAQPQPGLCYQCHNSVVELPSGRTIPNIQEQVAAATYRHDPVARGECSACHLPHASAQERLMRAGYPLTDYADYTDTTYALCFLCHDRTLVSEERTATATGFRDGDRNLHSVHVKRRQGRVCTLCHEMHVSNVPHLIRQSIPYGGAGWKLPIDYVETEEGGYCATGCHRKLGYDNTPPLQSGP